jgi:hypothetical protein
LTTNQALGLAAAGGRAIHLWLEQRRRSRVPEEQPTARLKLRPVATIGAEMPRQESDSYDKAEKRPREATGDRHGAGGRGVGWRPQRNRLQPNPLRWTALGWVNAAYIVLLTALWLLAPWEDDGKSTTFYWGFLVLIAARGGFEWWWKRNSRDVTAKPEPP